MGQVAVLHTTFGVGGAEAVCLRVLEALQYDHDVHLYGLTDPELDYLNSVFGTDVENITIHTPAEPDITLNGIRKLVTWLTEARRGFEGAFQVAALYSVFKSEWSKYDLRLTTHGELPLSTPAIQYLHHPFLHRWKGGNHFTIDSRAGQNFNKLLTKYVGATPGKVAQSNLLTNSEWTAGRVEKIYRKRPEVVYPPVSTEEFDPPAWSKKENGIVTVGRIGPNKNTLKACKLTEQLRQEDYDVHLHVVGPEGNNESYVEAVREYRKMNDWVSLEGRVQRDVLVKLLEQHRWGIHLKPNEHFGMVVAEYVAGGMVPFVPDSGGQVEIVDRHEALCYESIDDVVTSLSDLLDGSKEVCSIHDSLPDVSENFGSERFKKRILELVNEAIVD